ncbi:MAG: putative nucleotide-diphospho-sugar transferase [Cyanobacteria bacterium]|nr:putative nucleotide-diphospho-sugar transferase [Cyanobacteriota bacterium]MDA0865833.1 putative nucleotide-diphospho-sugar transferase [Cyanobacteriota bacterium]
MLERGVIYLAVNHHSYLEAALISAVALRAQDGQIPIIIISNLPDLNYLPLERYAITPRCLEPLIMADSMGLSRWLKTQINAYSPYDETLFLDADMLPLGNLSSLWPYLDQGDIAMATDRMAEIGLCDHVAPEEVQFTLDRLSPHTTHFNSGVLLWRRTATTEALFAQWHQEWQRFRRHDQLALARAIDRTQTAVVQLPHHYNLSPRDAEPRIKRGEPIHLLHCWGGKVLSGRFKKLAQRFCPEAVSAVADVFAHALEPERLTR